MTSSCVSNLALRSDALHLAPDREGGDDDDDCQFPPRQGLSMPQSYRKTNKKQLVSGTTGVATFLLPAAFKPPKHLRHPRPADTQMAGQRRPAFELPGVEQRLVMAGQFHAVRTLPAGWLRLRFFVRMGCPGVKHDDRASL